MTGDLKIDKAIPTLYLDKTASGQHAWITGQLNGLNRWSLSLGNSTAESAAAGSDWAVNRYNDAGVYVDSPLIIQRLNSQANFSGNLYACGGDLSLGKDGTHRYVGFYSNAYFYQAIATGTMAYFYAGGNRFWVEGSGGNFYISNGGLKPGGGPWADSSDARIKNVIGDYESGLEQVLGLRPVRYTFKGNDTPIDPEANKATVAPFVGSPHFQAATDGIEFIGFIAQEVEPVMPAMVTDTEGWIDGLPVSDLKILDTNNLIYALVNSVKELAATNQALIARITALEAT
jgi:hypothetical protein